MKIFYPSIFFLVSIFSGCINLSKYYGADIPKVKKSIGGHNYQKNIHINKATFVVHNLNTFLKATSNAKAGDIIYIKDYAKINLSKYHPVKIKGGVTIASGRCQSKGALIYTTDLKTLPLFITTGNNIKFVGLRIKGPDSLRRTEQLTKLSKISKKAYYSIPISQGIKIQHANIEIENCELWGWSHAAIYIKGIKSSAYIHHCFIHHNQRRGLGYGICVDDASALIEANIFDWNRHSISGTGKPNTNYEAKFNIVRKNGNGHAFDMHGGKDRKDKTNIAGKKISIHHNTFQISSKKAILIRGKPIQKSEVYNNLFENLDDKNAVNQINQKGNLEVRNNKFRLKKIKSTNKNS